MTEPSMKRILDKGVLDITTILQFKDFMEELNKKQCDLLKNVLKKINFPITKELLEILSVV